MKISEKELKQIIVEVLKEEDLDEGLIDKLRGFLGGAKGLGGAAADVAKDVAGKAGAAYGKGKYGATKQAAVKQTLQKLMDLKKQSDQFEDDEEFKAAVADAIKSLEKVGITADDLGLPTLSAPAQGFQRQKAKEKKEKAKQIKSMLKDVKVELEGINLDKKLINKILKGLKDDLVSAANTSADDELDSLDEAEEAGIELDKTLDIIDLEIDNPEQQEAVIKILKALLEKYNIKTSDPRLAKAEPADAEPEEDPTPEPEGAEEPQVDDEDEDPPDLFEPSRDPAPEDEPSEPTKGWLIGYWSDEQGWWVPDYIDPNDAESEVNLLLTRQEIEDKVAEWKSLGYERFAAISYVDRGERWEFETDGTWIDLPEHPDYPEWEDNSYESADQRKSREEDEAWAQHRSEQGLTEEQILRFAKIAGLTKGEKHAT